jgi:hypothetical protein
MPTDALRAACYRPHPDVATQTVDDVLILVHLGRGTTFRLNHTGSQFWQLMAAGQGMDEIVAHIAQRWQAKPEQIRKDLEQVITSCMQAGLLEPIREEL